jgi:hypothetical protein
MDSNGNPGIGEGVGATVPVETTRTVDVAVVEKVWVEVSCVETVDIASVVVAVTELVVVDVVVTGIVIVVVAIVTSGPHLRIKPCWPTDQPSWEATIQMLSRPRLTIGMGNTLVQVEPSQKRMTGDVPSEQPTTQPSLSESMYSEFRF